MAKMTSLEDPRFKRIAIARDTLVAMVPGSPLPIKQFAQNLAKHDLDVPSQSTLYEDMKQAREAMAAVPEVSEVKSWLAHLMMHLTSQSYKQGKFQSAIGGGKLLADLTGALAPPQEVDRSVDIARYLQEGRFFGRDGDADSVEDDSGKPDGADRAAGEENREGSAGQAVSAHSEAAG